MRRLADRGVIHVKVIADRPHHHLSGVQTDPNVDERALAPAQLLGVALDRLLHAQGGVTRPQAVVFESEGCSEQRHDSVAHHLVYGPLVTVDGLHHPFKHRIKDLAGLFGIAVGKQLHRALEVGEEHGHLLALALEGALRCEGLFCEVLGGVRLERGESRLACCPRGDGLSALQTEFRASGQLATAFGTSQVHASPTFEAELRQGRVLCLAAGTLHAEPPNCRAGLLR